MAGRLSCIGGDMPDKPIRIKPQAFQTFTRLSVDRVSGGVVERNVWSYTDHTDGHDYHVTHGDDGSLVYRTGMDGPWTYVSSRMHREIVRHFRLRKKQSMDSDGLGDRSIP